MFTFLIFKMIGCLRFLLPLKHFVWRFGLWVSFQSAHSKISIDRSIFFLLELQKVLNIWKRWKSITRNNCDSSPRSCAYKHLPHLLYIWVLVNHLKLSCRHHDSFLLKTSACLSWGLRTFSCTTQYNSHPWENE